MRESEFRTGNLNIFDVTKSGERLDGEMLREQYRSLATLMPYLYVVVILTTVMLAFTTRTITPVYVTVVLPFPLVCSSFYRMRYWSRALSHVDSRDIRTIKRDILGTKIFGPFLTLAFTSIGVLSISTGDLTTKLLVLVVIWVAAVTSAFCLFVLPRVAMLVIGASSVPLIAVFIYQGTEITMMLSLVIFTVSCLITYILRENFKNFAGIVQSRSTIAEKHRQAEIARDAATAMAFTDPLTNLSNRRHFEFLLNKRTQDELRKSIPFAVGMLDLDRFKPINDVYGHAAGDAVLKQVAERLATAMQGQGYLARMGGDEFAVIVENVGSSEAAVASGRDILTIFEKPFLLGPRAVNLNATCGFCLNTFSGDDPTRLVDRADMALYRLKTKERGGIAVFDTEDETLALDRAKIEHALRAAVLADKIDVHFQPIFDLNTGEIRAFESLARWTDPELGVVSPSDFIPIAEQMGLIGEMTDRLLHRAARVAVKWPAKVSLSFNISADQLSKPEAGPAILAILDKCGLSPECFEAEITETAIMRDLVNAKNTIGCLRAAGVRVSLDDFGTGHSSLSQLRTLALDKIKIDKSFVDGICDDPRTATLVRSLIQMSKGLDLVSVAEGIERQDQLDVLKSLGCDRGQGYLIACPLPADEACKLVSERASLAA